MQHYDYAKRHGVHELSWDDFDELCQELAESLDGERITMVLGIARAGLFPATAVALALRAELYPVRISRRLADEVMFETPQWRVPVPEVVRGEIVAVVDEIADTGETLSMVANAVREQGAQRVVTAALAAHPWADPMPQHTPLVTEALIIFPWGRQILVDGQWLPHPEVVAALEVQSE